MALALGLAVSGCAVGAQASDGVKSSVDRKKNGKQKAQAPKKQAAAAKKKPAVAKTKAAPQPVPKPARKKKPQPALTQLWVCSWAPTFDDDPHNDVLCDNGIASERPRLREWDDDVERSEMMESAREYALQRNAG